MFSGRCTIPRGGVAEIRACSSSKIFVLREMSLPGKCPPHCGHFDMKWQINRQIPSQMPHNAILAAGLTLETMSLLNNSL